jgi:hypothetical protein
MKVIIFIFFYTLSSFLVSNGQTQKEEKGYIQNQYRMDRLANMDTNSGSIMGMPLPAPGIIGQDYLDDNFRKSSFLLYDKSELEGYLSKYSIGRNEFEVQTNVGIRILKGALVNTFVAIDSNSQTSHVYGNARNFKDVQGEAGIGFFEILSESNILLLKKTEAIFKKSDYNATLNIGSRDHKYIKKEIFYFGKNNVYTPIPGKKKLASIFEDKVSDMQRFIDVNRIKVDNESHLKILFEHYRTLLAQVKN